MTRREDPTAADSAKVGDPMTDALRHDMPVCLAKSPGRVLCTREERHAGQHVGIGVDVLAVWPQAGAR